MLVKPVIIIAIAVVAVLFMVVNFGMTYNENTETIEREKQAQIIYEKEVEKCTEYTESGEEVVYHYNYYTDEILVPEHVENCHRDAIDKGLEFQCGSAQYRDCVNKFFENIN